MPWAIADVERFKKGLSEEQKQKWVKLANAIFESCMEREGAERKECERIAIATASSKVGDQADAMAFTEKPWDGDKSRFTIEQLLNKEHLKLPYREPDGTININAVRNALARLPQTEGLPNDVKAEARAELERILEEYRKRKGDSFVTRYDQAGVTLREENGLLIGEIALAKPDVYPYYDPADGKVHYEFKPPEEVLTDEFLQQTCLLPITDEHPSEGEVNDRNIQRLIKGMTGTSPRIEGNLVVNVGAVYDPALKEQIKRGDKRQVSIGFRTVVVDREGEFNGKKYDRVQTRIRLNHLAFTKAGRCGDQCAIKADGGQQMFTLKIGKDTVTFDCSVQDQAVIEKMQPVFAEAQAKIDAIVAKALEVAEAGEKIELENKELKQKLESLSKSDGAVLETMRQRAETKAAELQKQLDSAKTELEKAQAELSTLKGQLKAQQDLKDALTKQAQEIMAKADASVDERLKLIQYARSKQPYYQHTGKSNLEIKRDLAKMINPQLALDSVAETELDAYLKAWMDLDEQIERAKETALQNVARRVGLDARPRSEADELREKTLNLYQGNKAK